MISQAVFLNGTENATVDHCLFDALGGNGVFLNDYTRGGLVAANEFRDLGEARPIKHKPMTCSLCVFLFFFLLFFLGLVCVSVPSRATRAFGLVRIDTAA